MRSTGSSMSAATPTRSCSEKGIVKMPTLLPSRQMNTDSGMLPRAMAVITVPETMLTGAVAMMQTPIVSSSGKTQNASAQASRGISASDETSAAIAALSCRSRRFR